MLPVDTADSNNCKTTNLFCFIAWHANTMQLLCTFVARLWPTVNGVYGDRLQLFYFVLSYMCESLYTVVIYIHLCSSIEQHIHNNMRWMLLEKMCQSPKCLDTNVAFRWRYSVLQCRSVLLPQWIRVYNRNVIIPNILQYICLYTGQFITTQWAWHWSNVWMSDIENSSGHRGLRFCDQISRVKTVCIALYGKPIAELLRSVTCRMG